MITLMPGVKWQSVKSSVQNVLLYYTLQFSLLRKNTFALLAIIIILFKHLFMKVNRKMSALLCCLSQPGTCWAHVVSSGVHHGVHQGDFTPRALP